MESWDYYRTFLSVLREGSLSGAARAMDLSQPTVGRHINALEEALGAPLFSRSGAGLAPTEDALALRPHAEAMAAAAAALVRAVAPSSGALRGTIRIAAADVMGVEVLPSILTGFHEAHPEVVLELTLSNRREDMLRREADIAVRMVRPEQGALLTKRVGTVQIGLYAHRQYLEMHGTPTELGAPGFAAIGFDRDVQIARALRESQISLDRSFFSFRSDNDLAQLAALRAGLGIGGCQAPIARRDRNLVPVLQDVFRYEMEIWVAMHEDLKSSPRMRTIFDWLVEGLASYVRS